VRQEEVVRVASLNVRDLGDFIRDQRRSAQISLRQLAKQAGVSNPYLSQIERGLRKPSAEILQQIAKALRISAEVLYVQAGFLDEREGEGDVVNAIMRDEMLTERQRQVILDIYESFRGENAAGVVAAAARAASSAAEETAAEEIATGRAAAKPTPAKPTPAAGTKAISGSKKARGAGGTGAKTSSASKPAGSASAPKRSTTARSTTAKSTTAKKT
jgi:transcriptional regulator with XRE-family HTH domain